MNNQDWNQSNDALAMLIALKNYDEQTFNDYVNELQRFYIDCCNQKLFLLPQVDFRTALSTAEDFLNKSVSNEQVSHQNWYTEAAVFGMDYDEPPYEHAEFYENIAKILNLSFKDARHYAIDLGYFIDWASLYAQSFNGRIPQQHYQFLRADLLRKHLPSPF